MPRKRCVIPQERKTKLNRAIGALAVELLGAQ
jgi:hypothetical protein